MPNPPPLSSPLPPPPPYPGPPLASGVSPSAPPAPSTPSSTRRVSAGVDQVTSPRTEGGSRPILSPSHSNAGAGATTGTAAAPGAAPAPTTATAGSAFSRLFGRPTFEFTRPTFDFGVKKPAPSATTSPPSTAHGGDGASSHGAEGAQGGVPVNVKAASYSVGGKRTSLGLTLPDLGKTHKQEGGSQPTSSSSSSPPNSNGSGAGQSREDGLGVSARVQWSSPVRKKGDKRDPLSASVGATAGRGMGLTRAESGQMEEDMEDGPEDTEDGLFTHGECLSFHLTFGPGPIGLVVTDTKADKGVFVEDFIKIQTKGGPVATAAELSGRIKVGDVLTHVGSVDVQFSHASTVRELLEKCARPVTLSFERFPQRYSFKELSQDPRKMPFYFEYLLTDLTDMDQSRLEQAKVMFWMETDQFQKQFKNMSAPNRPKEAQRIFDKFLKPHVSQFDVSEVLGDDVTARLIDTCNGHYTAGPAHEDPRLMADMFEEARHVIEDDIRAGSYQGFRRSRPYLRMVGFLSRSPDFINLEAMEALQDPLLLHFFMLFLMNNRRHAALRCYLDIDRIVRPRVAALEALIKEGKAETDKGREVIISILQGALRVHSLYLSNGSYMELSLRPLTHLNTWLRAVLAARTDISRIQRRASKLNVKHPGKLLETEVVGNQLLRLAHSADIHTQHTLFALPVAEAMNVASELLDSQRSLLRELACDVWPRFQASPIYEALCEEIGTAGRTLRRQQATSPQSSPNPRSLLLKPGAIKRLLRKAKLPHEFAVHRCGLPPPLPPSSPILQPGAHSPTRVSLHTVAFSEEAGSEGTLSPGAGGGPSLLHKDEEGLDSCADWLVIFDTEFSQNLGLKVRSTSQIPVSAYAADVSGDKSKHCLPRGVENFLVPEEFPTKVSFLEPEPLLFNFLIPGREEQPFYGACLVMYRPATEAMLDGDEEEESENEDEDEEDGAHHGAHRTDAPDPHAPPLFEEPRSPMMHVDLTLSTTLPPPSPAPLAILTPAGVSGSGGGGLGGATIGLQRSGSGVGDALNPGEGTPYGHRTSDASVRTRSTTQSSLNENGEATPLSGGGENAYLMQLRQQRKMSFKIERAEEDEHKIKAMADLLLYSSPKHDEPRKPVATLGEGSSATTGVEASSTVRGERADSTTSPLPVVDQGEEEHKADANGQPLQATPAVQSLSSLEEEIGAVQVVEEGEEGEDEAEGDRKAKRKPRSGTQVTLPGVKEEDEEEEEEEEEGRVEEQRQAEAEAAKVEAAKVEAAKAEVAAAVAAAAAIEEQEGEDSTTQSIIALVAADFLESQMHLVSSSSGAEGVASGADLYALRDGPDGERYFGSSPGSTSASSLLATTPSTVASSKASSVGVSPNRRHPTLDDARTRRGSTSMSSSGQLSTRTGQPVPMATPLTFAPYGFCLISRLPFINSLRQPLAALFDQRAGPNKAAPIRIIQEALAKQAPVHPPLNATQKCELLTALGSGPGSGTRALMDAQLDFEVETLFRCLSPRNLVTVFLALLLECKIVLISEHYTLLTICAESLRLLVQPLRWCHVYVPLLPEVMVDHLIGCPTPYIMGLHRRTLLAKEDFPLQDVVQVDLDNDLVEAPSKDLDFSSVPFAAPLSRRFERFASPYTSLTDSFRWPGQLTSRGPDIVGALQVLRDFIDSLLVSMEDCCYRLCSESEMTILFDETLFQHINAPPELLGPCLADMDSDMLEHTPQLRRPCNGANGSPGVGGESFVLRFSRTQAFSQHLMRTLQNQHAQQQALAAQVQSL